MTHLALVPARPILRGVDATLTRLPMTSDSPFPFDPEIARQYTRGRIVRVVNNKGISTVGPVGTLGVVYQTFEDESAPDLGIPFGGFAVLFEHGSAEGFSLEQASWWLAPTPIVDPRLVDYHFAGLGTLLGQWKRGEFKRTFSLAHNPLRAVPPSH